MLIEISEIELQGEKFPVKMDNIVLQQIQKKYGTLNDFEIAIIGAKKVTDENGKIQIIKLPEPDLEAINYTLPKMILEGLAIREVEHSYTEDDLIRMIDKNIFVAADFIHNEFIKAIRTDESKKVKPNQTQKKPRNGKRLTLIGCIISALQNWACQRKQ